MEHGPRDQLGWCRVSGRPVPVTRTFKPQWVQPMAKLEGTIVVDGLPPHRGLIVNLCFFPVGVAHARPRMAVTRRPRR